MNARSRFGPKCLLGFSVFIFGWFALSADEQAWDYPDTPVREVVHEYGPVRLVDSFAWLEDKQSEEVEAWFRAQNDFTRSHIAKMPNRQELFDRIKEIDEAKTVQIYGFGRRGERYFHFKLNVGEDVPSLYYRDGADGESKLIANPGDFAKSEMVHSILGYSPSWDGKKVAINIGAGGAEIPDMYIIDVERGESLEEPITRVRSGASWLPDDSGFFYTQLRPEDPDQAEGDRYKRQLSKFHKLGTDATEDPVMVSYDMNRVPGLEEIGSPYVVPIPDTTYTLLYVTHGVDFALTLYYTRDFDPANASSTEWINICRKEDRIESLDLSEGTIYLLSKRNAPKGKLLKAGLEKFHKDNLVTLLPESRKVLSKVDFLGSRLYITGMDGGIEFVMTHDPAGESGFKMLDLPVTGTVTLLNNDRREDDAWFVLGSWTQAFAYYRYDPDTGTVEMTDFRPLGPFDAPEGIVTRRVMVESHDGVEVPLTIMHDESVELDGSNPTILYAYGAYGISQTPSFGPLRLAWFEQGGIFAVANIRGGGEYGKEWHQAGRLQTKRNSWLDLNACAEFLIEEQYTSSSRIAASGGSAGGLLVGRAMVSRPDLYGAIVSAVGAHNPVRLHIAANGPANFPEFGDPFNIEEFPYILAMDDYFAVQDGVSYPPMLLSIGYNDTRVDPWGPGKMAARLQQADPDGGPFLLRVEFEAGHGGVARSDMWEDQADEYAFLLWALNGDQED